MFNYVLDVMNLEKYYQREKWNAVAKGRAMTKNKRIKMEGKQ